MNGVAERCVKAALRLAKELGGAAGIGIEELLSLALDEDGSALEQRTAAAARQRSSRRARASSCHSDNRQTSLLSSDLRSREESSQTSEDVSRVTAGPVEPLQGPLRDQPVRPDTATFSPPAEAPKSRQFSLPDRIPPVLLAIAEAHRLADPEQSYGVYRLRRNGTGSEQDWTAWCLRERNRAPPESEARIRVDHESRERLQRAAHEELRRAAAPPPPEFLQVVARLAKGKPPDHPDSAHQPKAQGE